MSLDVDFAILAPVPLAHLQSGKDVAAKEGFVAFGSMKWELFRQVDALRHDRKVPVLLYPSHEGVPAKLSYVVAWFGWYTGHVESKGGVHPDGVKHRPPTTLGEGIGRSFGMWKGYESGLRNGTARSASLRRSRVVGARTHRPAALSWWPRPMTSVTTRDAPTTSREVIEAAPPSTVSVSGARTAPTGLLPSCPSAILVLKWSRIGAGNACQPVHQECP